MYDLVFNKTPVDDPITWGFGVWDDSVRTGQSYQHRGVDFGSPIGTSIIAPATGRSVQFTNDGSFGIAVCLEHEGTGLYSLYAHLSAAYVVVGQLVQQGYILGVTGNTGLSTGPHLHWQVCVNNQFPTDISYSRDPMSFIVEEIPMTPEERELLKSIAQVLTGTSDPTTAKSFIDQQNIMGMAFLKGYGVMWNNLWRHMNTDSQAHPNGLNSPWSDI